MRRILLNDDNLQEEDLDFEVIRVKGLIINSTGDILIAHNNGTYQFPGGHKEDDENLDDCLEREIREETGISVTSNGPFMQITTYDSNYFNQNKKVCNKIYYYVLRTDDKPNYAETHYDELECQTDFNLFYISIRELRNFLKRAMEERNLDEKIGREMLLVLDEYNNLYGDEAK
ncbi:MAG: NUDIX domain-containing protein [Mycoplasmatota bacterium]|nr:NUDIX domain-containing protein [Mycoplasmatota bacterium]